MFCELLQPFWQISQQVSLYQYGVLIFWTFVGSRDWLPNGELVVLRRRRCTGSRTGRTDRLSWLNDRYIVFRVALEFLLDHWSTHMNIRDLRRVFPAIGLQAYPRGFVLSRINQGRGPVLGFWILEQSPVQLRSFVLSTCIDNLQSTTYYLSSGFFEDGAGNDQLLKASRMWLCPFLWACEHFSPNAKLLCWRIVLVARFLLVFYPRILEHKDCALKVRTSE